MLLFGTQLRIAVDLFFLAVEGFNHHADEEIQKQQINQDLDENAEDDHDRFVARLGLHVLASAVHFGPHVVHPALRGLQAKEGENASEGCVKVEIVVNPLSSCIEAVPLRLNGLKLLLVGKFNVVVGAGPELACEERRVQDSKQEQEEHDDQLQVANVW